MNRLLIALSLAFASLIIWGCGYDAGSDEKPVPDFSGVYDMLVTYEENDCNPAGEGAVDAEFALVYRTARDFFMIVVGDPEPTLDKIELRDNTFSYSKLTTTPVGGGCQMERSAILGGTITSASSFELSGTYKYSASEDSCTDRVANARSFEQIPCTERVVINAFSFEQPMATVEFDGSFRMNLKVIESDDVSVALEEETEAVWEIERTPAGLDITSLNPDPQNVGTLFSSVLLKSLVMGNSVMQSFTEVLSEDECNLKITAILAGTVTGDTFRGQLREYRQYLGGDCPAGVSPKTQVLFDIEGTRR